MRVVAVVVEPVRRDVDRLVLFQHGRHVHGLAVRCRGAARRRRAAARAASAGLRRRRRPVLRLTTLLTLVSAVSFWLPSAIWMCTASTVMRPFDDVRARGPDPGRRRRQLETILRDSVDRRRRVGGRLGAVGEVDVAVEVGALDVAEARAWSARPAAATCRALDRGDVLFAARDLAEVDVAGERRRSAARRPRRRWRSATPSGCGAPAYRRPPADRPARSRPRSGWSPSCRRSHARCRSCVRRSGVPAAPALAGSWTTAFSTAARSSACARPRRRSGRCCRAPSPAAARARPACR